MKTFLSGSLRLEVKGDCERLINLCRENNIPLWNIERNDIFSVSISIRLYDIYTLRRLCRRAGCKLHTLEKKGLPFKAKRALRRPVLIIGLVLCAVALWMLSQRVWVIEVNTEDDINAEQVRQLLEVSGLRVGTHVKQVRAQKIKNSVIAKSNDIAYLTVNLRGSKAIVNVYRIKTKKEETSDAPCDVISTLTGVITAIRVRQGACELRVGQTVQAGDIIAKGEITDALGQVRYYRADAEIDLRTWYTVKCRIPTQFFEYIPTGETKKRSYIVAGNETIKLYLIETIGYKWYYKEVERKTLTLGDGIELPLTLVTETYTQCQRQEIELSEQEAEKLLKDRMLAEFAKTHPKASVVKTEFYVIMNEDTCEGVLRLECAETTGIQIER